MNYAAGKLKNTVGLVAINSWHAPVESAIYFELHHTALWDSERAAATFSPEEARTLASALSAAADMYEAHR